VSGLLSASYRRKLGIICGLQSEAACLSRFEGEVRVKIRVAGASEGRAAQSAEELLRDGASLLISFGLSGGLAPTAVAGDLVLAAEVVDEGGKRWRVDRSGFDVASAALLSRGLRPRCEPVLGRGEIVAGQEGKVALYRETGAMAVDMESGGVAQVSGSAGVPFLALRAIVDPAWMSIPSAAFDAIRPDGSIRTGQVLLRTLVRPWQILPLLQLQRHNKLGLQRLRDAAEAVLPAVLNRL